MMAAAIMIAQRRIYNGFSVRQVRDCGGFALFALAYGLFALYLHKYMYICLYLSRNTHTYVLTYTYVLLICILAHVYKLRIHVKRLSKMKSSQFNYGFLFFAHPFC